MQPSNMSKIKDFVTDLIKKEVQDNSLVEPNSTIQALQAVRSEIIRLEVENHSLEDQLYQGVDKVASALKDGYRDLHGLAEKSVTELFKATKPE